MAGLDWLSFLALDLAAGTVTLSLWAAGGALGLLLLFLVLAIFRTGTKVVLGAVVGIGLMAVAVVSAVTLINRQDRAEERRALDRRLAALTEGAIVPGSTFGCLDANIGEAVEGSCERAVFASPEAVAAATALVSARLTLLIDGLDFANRNDPNFENELAGLRRGIETDRFGFVAQVLAARDGCTAAKCDAFQWLRDATRIRGNLNERTFDGMVARNSSSWPARSRAGTPVAVSPAAPPNSPTSSGITFPSAASIPPVSIMNNEPTAAPPAAAPPATATPPAATPPRHSATPPPRTAQPRPSQPTTVARPVQLGPPPAANAGTQQRTQQP